MKRFYKVTYFAIVVYLLIACFVSTSAANLQTKLSVIQNASETKELENNQGYISKTIVNSNSSAGEVTIELKLENTKHSTESETYNTTEIMLVIDNSPSMDFVTSSGKTRKEIVISSAKELVNSIFNSVSNIKIGLVDFHGSGFLDSASLYNATVRLELTDKKANVIDALDKQLARSTSSGTNIDAGLQRAEKNFSKECKNKIIVLLTDGVPNADVAGNSGGNDVTAEENIKAQASTKATLQRLEQEGFHIISMMTGMSEDDGNTDKNGTTYDDGNLEDNLKAVENVFGTMQNPTAGKYYLATSADVDKIINENILNDVVEQVQNPINTVKIVDYFPEEIMENFEFSYVGAPSIGEVSENIDSETNTITWDIETLKGEETATLKYKLKIKDMQNQELLNKVISTNEKVVLTYIDVQEENYTVTLESSPKIKLEEVKQVQEDKTEDKIQGQIEDNKGDDTTAPNNIPQTGARIIFEVCTITVAIVGIFTYFKCKKLKDI